MKRINLYAIILIFLITGLLGSCQTVPETISEDLAPNEYFQKGQEALSKENYETALLYYRSFVERHPEMSQKVVEAEYETAFIYHKTGDNKTAKELFQSIVEKYAQPGADLLPAWPKVLSAKLLAVLNAEEEAAAAEAAPSTEAK